MERNNDDGPINLGTSIELMEDFFAYTFICQLKRKVIYDEDDSEDERMDIVADDANDDKPDDKDDGAKPSAADNDTKTPLPKGKNQIKTAYDVHAAHRISITSKCLLLVCSQLILLWYMLIQTTNDDDMIESLAQPAEKVSIVVGRFVCALVMHVTLTGESM